MNLPLDELAQERTSEERFQMLLDAVQDYAIYMLDPQGIVTTWNAGAQRNKGYTAAEIVGRSFHNFFPAEDVASGVPQKMLQEARMHGRYAAEGWRVRKDGTRFWASVVLNSIVDERGHLVGFAKITRDLTERKRQEDALNASQEMLQQERDRLKVTLYSIADGVISTDAAGAVTLMNPVAEALTGWTQQNAMQRPVEEVFHIFEGESGQPVRNPIRDCLEHGKAFYLQQGVQLLSRNGVRRDVQDSAAPIRNSEGDIVGAILVFQDVTHMRRIQREIEFNATHDSLTLLPNRRHFEQSLQESLHTSALSGVPHTVCFLDLDRFKLVNDTAGHAAGDLLLRLIADVLTRSVRASDVVARLGGDEFAVILSGCTTDQAQDTLRKIAGSIAALHFRANDHSFQISVSIGAVNVAGEATAADVMRHADIACYAAKNAGRNRVIVYHPEGGEGQESHKALNVAAQIRDALDQDRFALLAQKIVPTQGDAAPHYEILVRMLDRNGSFISPAQFIPSAERYDMMAGVDRWVLQRVLREHGSEIARRPGLRLSINLSANSLNDAKFLPFFLDLLERSLVPPDALTLEITETSLMDSMLNASKVIEKLRAVGCKVALDDFGIGLCSFSYLRNFTVDYVKIEGSFVRNVLESPVDLAIVRSINTIAHELKARTIAEFVENDAILEQVRALGIDFAQGYALGRPEPIAAIFNDWPGA